MQSRLPLSLSTDKHDFSIARLFRHNRLYWKLLIFAGLLVGWGAINLKSDAICQAVEFVLGGLFVVAIFMTKTEPASRSPSASRLDALRFALLGMLSGPMCAFLVPAGLEAIRLGLSRFSQVVIDAFPTDYPLVQSAISLINTYSVPITVGLIIALSIAGFRIIVIKLLSFSKVPASESNIFGVVLASCFCLPSCLTILARSITPDESGLDLAGYGHAMAFVGFLAAFIVLVRLSFLSHPEEKAEAKT
jgi:hypothetical protein